MSPELHKDQFFYYYFMDFYQFYDLIDFFPWVSCGYESVRTGYNIYM